MPDKTPPETNMSTRTLVFVAAIGLISSGAWIAIRSARSIDAAAEAIRLAQARAHASADRLKRQQARLAAIDARRTELRQMATDRPAAAKSDAKDPARPPAAAARVPSPREIIENDPRLQALWLESGRANLQHEYGPLFASAHFTAAQIEKFRAAMMKRQEQLMDLSAVGQTRGSESKAAIETLRQQANTAFENEVRDALGEEGSAQFREYQRSVAVRPMLERMAGFAALQGEPLTSAQAEQLTAIVANACPDYAAGGRANLAKVDWGVADAEAETVLTPDQMALFKHGIRSELQLDAAVARAQQADQATLPSRPKSEG